MASSVVQLLRAQDNVFYDIDSIPAGERWRDALLLAIDNASHFYLLWCMHSAGSEEVEWEWQRAISGNKRLVPVLLDSTPLVKPLTEYQWVDFQGVVQGHEPPRPPVAGRAEPPPPEPAPPPPEPPRTAPPPPPHRRRVLPLFALALTIFVVVAVLPLSQNVSDPPAVPSAWPALLIAALAVVVVLVLAVFGLRRYQRSRRTRAAEQRAADQRAARRQAAERRAAEQRAAELLAEAIAHDLARHGGGS